MQVTSCVGAGQRAGRGGSDSVLGGAGLADPGGECERRRTFYIKGYVRP